MKRCYEYKKTLSNKSKVIGDSITDLRDSRLRQLGGTSLGVDGKPIEKWNIKMGLNFEKFQNINMKLVKF